MLLKDVKAIKEVVLTGNDLTLEQLIAVSRYGAKLSFDPDAVARIKASRALIDDIVNSDRVVYGVTTGFGPCAAYIFLKEDCAQLQENLIRTHSCGYGKPSQQRSDTGGHDHPGQRTGQGGIPESVFPPCRPWWI